MEALIEGYMCVALTCLLYSSTIMLVRGLLTGMNCFSIALFSVFWPMFLIESIVDQLDVIDEP